MDLAWKHVFVFYLNEVLSDVLVTELKENNKVRVTISGPVFPHPKSMYLSPCAPNYLTKLNKIPQVTNKGIEK